MEIAGTTQQKTPPTTNQALLQIDTRHNVGHIKLGKSPSDTCLHTCTIFNQNVNSLGGKREDKPEKLISLMRERKIHAWCIQETWQLYNYMITI